MCSIVKLEPTRKSKLIPQCKSCQGYGHTQNYCAKPPRCVKCSGHHATKDCHKNPTEPPKCVNCGECHPANYRGCLVAKELQKLRKLKQTPNINHILSRQDKNPEPKPQLSKKSINDWQQKTNHKTGRYLQQSPNSNF